MRRTIWVVLACLGLMAWGCSEGGDSPALTVERFFATVYNNDAVTEKEIMALAESVKNEFFHFTTDADEEELDMALPVLISLSSKVRGTSVEFVDVKYDVEREDGQYAEVRMHGTVRVAKGGGATFDKDLDSVYTLVKTKGKWKLSGLE